MLELAVLGNNLRSTGTHEFYEFIQPNLRGAIGVSKFHDFLHLLICVRIPRTGTLEKYNVSGKLQVLQDFSFLLFHFDIFYIFCPSVVSVHWTTLL